MSDGRVQIGGIVLAILVFGSGIAAAGTSLMKDRELVDSRTQAQLPVVQSLQPGLTTHVFLQDSMDQGDHNFGSEGIVIDPTYYETHEIERGDIVTYNEQKFKNPSETYFTAARVVGLPGERVKIVQGQVLIDEKKLNTFYGHERRMGKPVADSRINVPQVTVPAGHYYLLADNWWRWKDISQNAPLPKDALLGKVIGRH